jgi:hypothetical protein
VTRVPARRARAALAILAGGLAVAVAAGSVVIPSQRWGITASVSPQATVALKDGWLPLDAARKDWQVNSIGWVSGGGRDYLIAVLSTGNPTPRYGVTTIARLSSIVWDDLG